MLDIIVKEKPTIREINYKGLNSVSTSDVLDRFKKEHVGLSVESPYDPTKLARAIDVIRALLAEHGHQFATVKPEIKTIPPASVSINFNIKEGPTVKVGNITFTGNQRGELARVARGDEKSAADRDSALHFPGEHLRPHLRRQQARGRYGTRAPRAARSRLFPRRGRRSHHPYPQ